MLSRGVRHNTPLLSHGSSIFRCCLMFFPLALHRYCQEKWAVSRKDDSRPVSETGGGRVSTSSPSSIAGPDVSCVFHCCLMVYRHLSLALMHIPFGVSWVLSSRQASTTRSGHHLQMSIEPFLLRNSACLREQ